MIQLDIQGNAIERANRALAGIPGASLKAIRTSINKAAEGAKTDAARGARDIYHIKISDITKTITLKRASGANLQAIVESHGGRKSLADYKLAPRSPQKRAEGVKAAVKREGGLKPIPNAFVASSRSGGVSAFIRDPDGLRKLTSPAVPQLLKNTEVAEHVERSSHDRVGRILDHEILRLLGAFG